MSFKDQVASDIEATFLNTEEFADTHMIDGVPMVCVLKHNQGGSQIDGDRDLALWVATVTLHARTSELAALPQGLPKAGRNLLVDGKRYLVLDPPTDEMGMCKITMELVKS